MKEILSKFAFWRKFSRYLLIGFSALVLLAYFQTATPSLFADDDGDSCSGSKLGRNITTGECRRFEDMCLPYGWLIDSSCPYNSPLYQSSGSPSCTLNVNPSSGTTSTMFNLSPTNLYTPNGSPRYEWDIDDNGTFNDGYNGQTSISRTFPNTTRVTLRLVDNVTSGTCSTTVNITGGSTGDVPTCSISPFNPSYQNPQTVNFNATVNPVQGRGIQSYQWSFNGAYDSNYTGTSASHYFPQSQSVRLRIYDGFRENFCDSYVIIGSSQGGSGGGSPICEISPAYRSGNAPLYVDFNAGNSRSTSGNSIRYDWDFDRNNGINYGDSSGYSVSSRRFDYDNTVNLRVTDQGNNLSSTCSSTIDITNDSANPGTQCDQIPYNCTNGRQIYKYYQSNLGRCDYDYNQCNTGGSNNCSNFLTQETSCQNQQTCYVSLYRDASCNIISRGQPTNCQYIYGQCGYTGGNQPSNPADQPLNCPAGTTAQAVGNNQSAQVCMANINTNANANFNENINNIINENISNSISSAWAGAGSAWAGAGGAGSASVNITW